MQENHFSTEFTGNLTFDEATKRGQSTTDTQTSVPVFSTAAAAWFEDHKRYIKPNTADSYGDALGPLNRFFGDKPINAIEIVHLRMYQDLRSAKVCAHTVNRELGVLQQVLREFDEWKRLESRYRQVPQPPRRAGHTLTYEEEQRIVSATHC
jgi:Phage integrase, N-terminal SAM-like domain